MVGAALVVPTLVGLFQKSGRQREASTLVCSSGIPSSYGRDPELPHLGRAELVHPDRVAEGGAHGEGHLVAAVQELVDHDLLRGREGQRAPAAEHFPVLGPPALGGHVGVVLLAQEGTEPECRRPEPREPAALPPRLLTRT